MLPLLPEPPELPDPLPDDPLVPDDDALPPDDEPLLLDDEPLDPFAELDDEAAVDGGLSSVLGVCCLEELPAFTGSGFNPMFVER